MNPKDPEQVDLEMSRRASVASPQPDEFANPAGVGGETCEAPEPATTAEPCDPSEIEDLVLEESKPGYGISGYEGEEVGGG